MFHFTQRPYGMALQRFGQTNNRQNEEGYL